MDAQRWFATASLDDASGAAIEAVSELVHMLDTLQPSRMDVGRSRVHVTAPGQEGSVEVLLAHALDKEADVSVAIDADGATISWLNTHEHVYGLDSAPDRPWTMVVSDAVAAVLRGEYELQEYSKYGRVVRTALVDATDGRRLSTTGTLLGLLVPGRARPTQRRRVDFGCTRRVNPDGAG